MPRELIYTAADEGIDGLRGCLCYAGASNDALSNKLLLQNLLAINNYQELYKAGNPKAHSNPIGFSHYRFNAGARDCSVISRIGPAPLYANRTNFIAHHVILEDVDKAKAGPAWAINNFKFRDHWSPQIGRIDTQRLAIGSLEPRICNYWKSIVGDAGWAGWLAERALSGKPITVLYPTGLDPLALIQEAIALLPEYQRWNITFSTYYTLGGRGPNCTLRFIPLDADSLAAPFSDKTFHDGVLNLSRSLGNAPAGALVSLARGEKPKDKPIPSGLGLPSGSSFIPSFDPNKSDIPGLMSSKDPILGKSELSIDTKTNFESFDNLKPSGPDNTWKTIAFAGGILGLLFLLVLPPLFTWLIASSINHEKLAKLKNDKNDELNNLVKEVDALEKNKNEEIECMLTLFEVAEILKKENATLGKQVSDQNELYSTKNIEESKNLDDLKFKLNDKKFNGITGFKMPKSVVVELQKIKIEQEKTIIKDGPKEKESWLEFIDKNKGKVLEKGDGISKYIDEIEKNAKAKYEGYGNIQKYYKAKQWIDKDKAQVKLPDVLKKLEDKSADLKKTIAVANKNGIPPDDYILLPSESLVALAVLIKQNENNLYFENTFKNSLKELVEILLDEKMAHFHQKKIEDYVRKNETGLKYVKELQEIVVQTDIKILTKSHVEIPKKEWDSFIHEFGEHLKKNNFNEIGDPKDKVSKKALALNRFIKKKIDDFMSMKGGAK
jgi:hypothetical protein